MRNIKFVTTFSKNGYHVYGKSWIESFLEFTKSYEHITAKIYVDGMNLNTLNYGNKVEFVDFDVQMPHHREWVNLFRNNSRHDSWNKDLAVKFSFKSFVMINELKTNNEDIVIWLDADSIFTSYDFETFPVDILNNKFLAIQKEDGSEHCESGIVIFDSAHQDKTKFVQWFESQYLTPSEFNSYGQFFDGFVLNRTISNTAVDFIDLNLGYGIGGIQSDPSCTFLNPALRSRFYHNIGITGKRNYQDWKNFAQLDPFFKLIHGFDGSDVKTKEQLQKEKLEKVNSKISKLRRR
jgi:hypothetical protein